MIDVKGINPELTKEVVIEQVHKLFGKNARMDGKKGDDDENTASV